MNARAEPVPSEVQRLLVYAYPLNRSRHYVLRVKDPAGARQFIGELARYVTTAEIERDEASLQSDHGYCPLNIGFTYRGLAALGVPGRYLRVFQEKARAFAEGAYTRAARRLGDTGVSAAQWWDKCFRPDSAHVLLTLHANEEEALEKFSDDLKKRAKDSMTGWTKPLSAAHLGTDRGNRRVHFGFRDGIASPDIEGFRYGNREPLKPHAPGEFLLGYPNDKDFNPWLLINPSPRPNPWLLPMASITPAFFRNGTFGVLRKMEQHEERFDKFVESWAQRLDVAPDYIKAKLVGRWSDGAVVTSGTNEAPTGTAGDLNAFDFSDDLDGEGCPYGSHIRRMNERTYPRVVPFRRRVLMRRGMPYGAAYDKDQANDGDERGLIGLFFCANLEDQFEHLLSEWSDATPMGTVNRGDAKDPLIGHHDDPDAVFDIPMPGDSESLRQITQFSPFITTRGTLYAFFPGATGLNMIADPRKLDS